MRWTFGATCAAALVSIPSGSQVAGSSVYHDAETGFTFSQYNAQYSLDHSIAFRIAVPSPVLANATYDAVIQVVAPVEVGWTGLAWGGNMLSNPLSVSWANGNNVVLSSRYATAHTTPSAYRGASYEMFKTGTHVNKTHWQYTAKCAGCTSYIGASNGNTILNPTGGNRLAFAYSATRPGTPSSNTSSITVHDVTGYWTHDFSMAGNTAFTSLLVKNLGHA